jgi:hypothetical protein
MTRKPLTEADVLQNVLREIAASGAAKGGEWASEQAFSALEHIERKEVEQEFEMNGPRPLLNAILSNECRKGDQCP